MICCIAVDDEPLALNLIRIHSEKISFLNLDSTFLSVIDAINYINNTTFPIDVIFLDINMPELNGLMVRKFIPNEIQIVFITAYEKFALKSYEVDATDYLLKPFSFERFYKAVLKCQEVKGLNNNLDLDHLGKTTVWAKGDKKVHQIKVSEISFIEGLKDYARIHFGNGQKLVIRESLKTIAQQFSGFGFIRVHRSYIIPFDKISSVYGNMVRIGDFEIPINKTNKEFLLNLFRTKGILGGRK